MRPTASLLLVILALLFMPMPVHAQIKAVARRAPAPAWNKGILPISSESYWNAVECGKQGGDDPPCVFWDTGLCQNDAFTLALWSPYKFVAYEVWQAIRQKKPAPTPSYSTAQRTRITVGVTPVKGSKSALTSFVLKRGSQTIAPVDRYLDAGGGRFTFDYPAFAATAAVTLSMVAGDKTVSCVIDRGVLAQFR